MTKLSLVLTLVLALVLATGAQAAKEKPSGTISQPTLVADANGDGLVSHGDAIRFTVSTIDAPGPFVHLECFQAGALVAEGWEGYFATALYGGDGPGVFTLSSPLYTGGAATCTADLVYSVRVGANGPVWKTLASTAFDAN